MLVLLLLYDLNQVVRIWYELLWHEYVGGIVLAVGMLVPFGLAMAEFEYFWIANAIYLAFVVSALTASVVKIVAYRRGL